MTRRLVIESSEDGRTEIHYSLLEGREITGRMRTYEKRSGADFDKFRQDHNCDAASPPLLKLNGIGFGKMRLGIALHVNGAELDVSVGKETFADGH